MGVYDFYKLLSPRAHSTEYYAPPTLPYHTLLTVIPANVSDLPFLYKFSGSPQMAPAPGFLSTIKTIISSTHSTLFTNVTVEDIIPHTQLSLTTTSYLLRHVLDLAHVEFT